MKKKFIFLTCLVVLAFNTCLLGQGDAKYLNYMPPTPNSAALFKSVDNPVSLSTGTINVGVPFFSYSKNNLNLNVSLDYQTQGIKVEEIASNVGLGWALNAGGLISRQMRGIPDDYSPQGYMYLGNNQDPTGYEAQYADNGKDSEQDIFNFSFPGGGGKFTLSSTGQAILFGQRKLKVETVFGSTGSLTSISGFVITDESGIKYTFDVLESTSTTISSLLPSYFIYTSGWHLRKIENVFTNESIVFNYSVSNVKYKTRNAQTLKHRITILGVGGEQMVVNPGIENPNSYNDIKDFTTTGVKISSINLPDNSQVWFEYATQLRADVGNDYALSKITILNDKGETVKGLKLYQSYINDQGVISAYASTSSSDPYGSSSLRMRLDQVQELSASLSTNPGYIYQYDDSYYLPERFSAKQDHWGFYNGEKNAASTYIVPRAVYKNIYGYQLLTGTDPLPDPLAVKASSLKKITYPTGGHLQLDYEVNQAGDNKLIDSTAKQYAVLIANPEGSTNTTQSFSISRLETNTPIQFRFKFLSTLLPPNNGCSINLKIMTDDLLTTISDVSFDISELGMEKTTQLTTLANGTYKAVWQINPVYCAGLSQSFSIRIYWNQLEINNDQYAGGLRIKKTSYSDGSSMALPIVKEYKYITETGQSSGVVLRSPRYTSILSETTEDQVEGTYNIVMLENGYTSGNTTYYSSWVFSIKSVIFTQKMKNYLLRSSASNYPLTYSSGTNIMYSRVEVIHSSASNTDKGKEVFYYTTYKDLSLYNNQNTFFASPPFVPVQVPDWQLGLLTKKLVFDNSNTLLEKEENNYYIQTSPVDDHKNFKIAWLVTGTCEVYNVCHQFNSKDYYWQVGKSELTQSTKTLYTALNGPLVQTTNYTYDPVYFALKKQTTTNSLGNTIEKRIYYPYDYTMAGVLQQMVSSNIIGSPVSNETWKINGSNEYLLTADAIEYKNISGLIVPDKYHVLNTATPINVTSIGTFNPGVLLRDPSKYSADVVFESYDNKGNVVQLDAKGIKRSYIWDNLSSGSPVAEVINSTQTNIAYSSFESDGKGNWTYSGLPFAEGSSPTGKKVYNLATGNISKTGLSISTTYIISYWTKNTSAFSITGTISGYPIQGRSLNGWQYFEHKITGQSMITMAGTGLLDELRLYPDKALMSTITYDLLVGTTSQCDANNRISYYEYDVFNRLVVIRDMDKNVAKKICYNYTGQVENCDIACTNTAAAWQNTATTIRCQQGSCGNTGYQEQEQRDMNTCSPTYNQTQWVVVGYNPSICTLPNTTPNWQNTTTALRCQLSNGQNTGWQEQEQQDINTCSPTYNQTQWVQTVYNTTACPLQQTCNTSNCTGEAYKCVFGQCEMGFRINITTSYNPNNNMWECIYRYEFSDGSWSQEYSEFNTNACPL